MTANNLFGSGWNSSKLSSVASARSYPDPFQTFSAMLMPKTIEESLRWSEQLWYRNGTYAMAMKRVIAYFMTRIEILDASPEEKERYEKLLNTTLNTLSTLSLIGADKLSYGNSFSSVYVPFRRTLQCEKKGCGIDLPITRVNYSFKEGKIKWKCEACGHENSVKKPIDRRTADETKIKIKRWSPHEIKIMHHPISGDSIYLWDPPPYIVKKIKEGDKFYLEYFPWEMVEAITAGKMFEFAPRVVYHMKDETLAGINAGGWGISQFIPNFSQAYYVQMAKMYNEVLMLEYIIPFRVVTPAPGGDKTDPLLSSNIGNFNSKVMRMFDEHRRNPGGWHALPRPIEYQALGSEGMQMTTYEHIGAAVDEMLNAAGVPAELYKGTVQFQALPTALRLFQSTWPHLVADFNGWLNWFMETLAVVFNWDQMHAKLQPVTLADDIEKKGMLLQLMAGQQISKNTAYAPLGISERDELKKIYAEKRMEIEEDSAFQLEQQQKQMMQDRFSGNQQAQAMSGPGGQPNQGGSPTITVDDMANQADQEADRLLGMPYEQRKSEMLKLKKSNENLWAYVKAKMQTKRQSGAAQGVQDQAQQMQSPQQPVPQG